MKISQDEIDMCKKQGISVAKYKKSMEQMERADRGYHELKNWQRRTRRRNSKLINDILGK